MANKWFYSQDGVRRGPVSSAELRQLAREGVLKPQDLLWKEGMAEWLPASKTQGLFPDVGPGTAASPPPLPSQENEAAQPSFTAVARHVAGGIDASMRRAYVAQVEKRSARQSLSAGNSEAPTPEASSAISSPAQVQRRQTSFVDRIAGVGCLGMICLFATCLSLPVMFPFPPNDRLEGETIVIDWLTSSAQYGSKVDTEITKMMWKVWDSAKKYPDAKNARITVTMSHVGIEDKYGNEMKSSKEMGTIEIDDLDEVRRFVDSGHYGIAPFQRARYESDLRRMPGIHLLEPGKRR